MPSAPTSNELALFRSITVTPEQALAKQEDALKFEQDMERARGSLFNILPVPEIILTDTERLRVDQQRLSAVIMDAAGAAAMRCDNLCPFRGDCSLFIVSKHPVGQLCPFEVDYLRERFLGWLREFNRTLDTVIESERLAIGNLCSLQLELQRIRKILSRPQNAEMNQVSVRDVNAETGEALCWENVIHTAAQRENDVLISIRMIMKDFELTPEQKTKRAKFLGLRDGSDLASKQSALHAKLKGAQRRVIETTAVVEVAAAAPGPIR